MKRLFSLLCAVLILSLVRTPALADFDEDDEWDNDPVYHELWGVPWGAGIEEFLEKAGEHSGIPFQVFEDDISIPSAWERFRAACFTSPDDPVYLFNYPVRVSAEFDYEPVAEMKVGDEGVWVAGWYWRESEPRLVKNDTVWVAEAGGMYKLVSVIFHFLLPYDSELSAWFMADDIFHKLCSQYGHPESPFIVWRGTGKIFFFPLPIIENRMDIPKLFAKGFDQIRNSPIHADFDNISYEFYPDIIDLDKSHAIVTLEFTAPGWGWTTASLRDLAGEDRPFEDFGTDPGEGRWPFTPPPAPTPAPKHIDAALW